MMTITIAAAAICAAAAVMRARAAKSDFSHAGIFGGFEGTTVPSAAYARVQLADGKGLAVVPTTGVVSPHLNAPPG